MRPIAEIAQSLGLGADEYRIVGPYVAKVPLAVVRARAGRPARGKLILVTGMTPTRHGEGKTVTVIGLVDGLSRLGRAAVACVRQPSLGPVFGIKGGATGGGRTTVEPSTEINFGFTGDIYAVASAHNLLAAAVDNHLFHGNSLGIDPERIVWPRTMDMEDRALRHITVARDDPHEPAHPSSFVITAASEVMAILALARDYADLKERLGRILVGFTRDGAVVRARDLKVVGGMAALLRDALEPNLVQTSEGAPALIHAGPFGNLAHGTSSRVSIELGLATSDYCVVEAGFATELGAEKFVDIVTPTLGHDVDAAVLVVTQRALRWHGGASDEESMHSNLEALEKGLPNLEQHLENLKSLGLAGVVALNRFPDDSPAETEKIRELARRFGVNVVEARGFAEGWSGCADLAREVVRVADLGQKSHPISPPGTPVMEQVTAIATRLYGASTIVVAPEAEANRAHLESIGEGGGPVCVAKTPLSLSDDAHRHGRPRDFAVRVARLTRSAGAGFTVVYLGAVETMPGLPARPAAEEIDLAPDGSITGAH
ncbi:MAG TPA: formate--tetrahydrofolate ligase [Thermoplasmata archaeon]|nr:formate--tetrahydrofolate ligase [Thermoplasmata archaeon]